MTTEYQQSFESLINSFEGKLTDADQELIHIILGEPSEAVFYLRLNLHLKLLFMRQLLCVLQGSLGLMVFQICVKN